VLQQDRHTDNRDDDDYGLAVEIGAEALEQASDDILIHD
jgi:hypothetical protein